MLLTQGPSFGAPRGCMPAASNLERPGGEIDVVGSLVDLVHLLNGSAGLSNPCTVHHAVACPCSRPMYFAWGLLPPPRGLGGTLRNCVAESTRGSLRP